MPCRGEKQIACWPVAQLAFFTVLEPDMRCSAAIVLCCAGRRSCCNDRIMEKPLCGTSSMKGYVQVYTGNGKGKTTAALGLALRAAGAGLRVFVAQFVKGNESSEIKALRRFEDLITVRQFGTSRFIVGAPDDEDIRVAQQGWEELKKVIAAGAYDVVVLDELNIAIYYKLISSDELVELIESRPEHLELIITGRHAHEKILARADLVTEMREVKHYYTAGVQAREGIEK